MQPGSAPLQRCLGGLNFGLERKQKAVGGSCNGLVRSAIERPPISPAGVEANEPILPEIERLVLDGRKAEHAKAGPQKPARPRGADDAINVLAGERRERVVSSGRKDIVVDEAESFGLARCDEVVPSPVEHDPVRAARRIAGPRICRRAQIGPAGTGRDTADRARGLVRQGIVDDDVEHIWNVVAQQAGLPRHKRGSANAIVTSALRPRIDRATAAASPAAAGRRQ